MTIIPQLVPKGGSFESVSAMLSSFNSLAAKSVKFVTVTPPPVMIQRTHRKALVEMLTEEHKEETLSFLANRPIHTVCMVGLIHDNGMVSDLNRGSFYGFRNEENVLEGISLIGHATLIEANTERALKALSHQAQNCTKTHMIMGEKEGIEKFWRYYSEDGQPIRLACRELLFELKSTNAIKPSEQITGLRLATAGDLELVMPVQAQMAFDESGVNPMKKDPSGFRQRCLRRIEKGRTWMLVDNGRLIFKAEVYSDTPEVVYLEGIYVDSQERGKGFGKLCLNQLCQTLFSRTRSICILVNEQNKEAQGFYRNAGFEFKCLYDTIFLGEKYGF
ncbi:MAG: GNAT family N-acetyltransferase [Acidobacteriota bacterium]|nr:GNAT family N-acetyltransferase [Acidobacteriota bacterium]